MIKKRKTKSKLFLQLARTRREFQLLKQAEQYAEQQAMTVWNGRAW